MTRPKTKRELIEQGTLSYQKLKNLLDALPNDAVNGTFVFDTTKLKGAHWQRDKNIRDVLAHLHEWHVLLLDWIEANQSGQGAPFLQNGYNWRTYGDLNVVLWEKHQHTTYEEVLKLVDFSHAQVTDLAQHFTEEELFTKGVFDWVGDITLGSYFVSTTVSHYDWAMRKTRKYLNTITE